ncbi:MAG: hypothetical protein HYZ34_10935 [Ignavibacteriae bacterium]|nr:hypothetical protein [Ignavibacteriota bacterium]
MFDFDELNRTNNLPNSQGEKTYPFGVFDGVEEWIYGNGWQVTPTNSLHSS